MEKTKPQICAEKQKGDTKAQRGKSVKDEWWSAVLNVTERANETETCSLDLSIMRPLVLQF